MEASQGMLNEGLHPNQIKKVASGAQQLPLTQNMLSILGKGRGKPPGQTKEGNI